MPPEVAMKPAIDWKPVLDIADGAPWILWTCRLDIICLESRMQNIEVAKQWMRFDLSAENGS